MRLFADPAPFTRQSITIMLFAILSPFMFHKMTFPGSLVIYGKFVSAKDYFTLSWLCVAVGKSEATIKPATPSAAVTMKAEL